MQLFSRIANATTRKHYVKRIKKKQNTLERQHIGITYETHWAVCVKFRSPFNQVSQVLITFIGLSIENHILCHKSWGVFVSNLYYTGLTCQSVSQQSWPDLFGLVQMSPSAEYYSKTLLLYAQWLDLTQCNEKMKRKAKKCHVVWEWKKMEEKHATTTNKRQSTFFNIIINYKQIHGVNKYVITLDRSTQFIIYHVPYYT